LKTGTEVGGAWRYNIRKRYPESGIQLPAELPDRRHVWHIYAPRVQTAKRDELLATLRRENIGVGLHYPILLQLQPCLRDLGYVRGDFPQSEAHAMSEISLPIYPELSPADVDNVSRIVHGLHSAAAINITTAND